MPGIGLLNEKPLHAALKAWYAQPGDQFEVTVEGYVIDIVRDDLLLEIQTGSFSSIKSKLNRLIRSHPIRLIYPIAQEKWIIKLPKGENGNPTRRKSPKRGRLEDLFREMVSIPHLATNDNFTLDVLMIQQEEIREYDRKRNWRRKGWGIQERRLLAVVSHRRFQEPADWQALLPKQLDESFTTRDISEAAGISRRLAQQMAYCLRHMGTITLVGKKAHAHLYRIVDA